VTGASGSVFAVEMLKALDADVRVGKVDFIPSEAALRVFAEEMQLSGRNGLAEKLLGGRVRGRLRSSRTRTSVRTWPAEATAQTG